MLLVVLGRRRSSLVAGGWLGIRVATNIEVPKLTYVSWLALVGPT